MLADPVKYTQLHRWASSHTTTPGGSETNIGHVGHKVLFHCYANCVTKTENATKINLQALSATADSGSSDILLRQSDATVGIIQDNKLPNITVMLPNNQTV